MSTAEACSLVVDLVREMAKVRAERDAYQLLAREALHALHHQHVESERLRERYHAVLDARRADRQGKAAA